MPYEPEERAKVDLVVDAYIEQIDPIYEPSVDHEDPKITGYTIQFLIIDRIESKEFSEQAVTAELLAAPHNSVPQSTKMFWDKYGRFVRVGIDLDLSTPKVFSTFCGGTYMHKQN